MKEALCDYCNGPLGDKWMCIPRMPRGYTKELPKPPESSGPDTYVDIPVDRYCQRCQPINPLKTDENSLPES